jgi:hypothetical protein
MAQAITSDYLQDLYTFPFKDERWKTKFAVGSVLALVLMPFVYLSYIFLYGYSYRIMRGIIVEDRQPFMPEWDDWGQLIGDGLKMMIVVLLPMIPMFLISMSIFPMMFGATLIPALLQTSGRGGGEIFLALLPLSIFFFTGIGGVMTVLTYLLQFMLPAAMGHVVATGELGAMFRFREWWPIFRVNIFGFVMAFVLYLVVSLIITFVMYALMFTIILCVLLPFFFGAYMFYLILIQSTLYAQAYREGVLKLEEAGLAGEGA